MEKDREEKTTEKEVTERKENRKNKKTWKEKLWFKKKQSPRKTIYLVNPDFSTPCIIPDAGSELGWNPRLRTSVRDWKPP